MLYAKFQPSTMSGSGQKVCGGGGGWVLRPIIVLSLSSSEAEQNSPLPLLLITPRLSACATK